MRKLLRIAVGLVFLLFLASLAALWMARRASRQVPAFYAEALDVSQPPLVQAKMSDDVERDALELHNETRTEGRWEAVFVDQELNAWAATVLPEKFPKAMPAGVSEPRVKFAPDTVHVACRFKDDDLHLDTVLSIEAQVFLTDQPNEIAIRVNRIRAGSMPLLRGPIIDRVLREARNAGMHLQQTQWDDDPVLKWRLSVRPDPKQSASVLIRSLVVRENEIYLTGETVDDSSGS